MSNTSAEDTKPGRRARRISPLAVVLALISIGPASGAPVIGGGEPLSERADGAPVPAPWILSTGADGVLPDGLTIGGRPIADLSVYPQGVLVLDGLGFDADAPRPLGDLRMAAIIAPFWSTLALDACPDRAPGLVSRVLGPSSLTVIWRDVSAVGCPGREAATFSVELTWDAQAVVHRLELRFEALPGETPAVEPRAGLRLGGRAPMVFELLPDLATGPLRGRAKRLLEGSSDGEAGAWIIELDAAGQIIGDIDLDGWRSVDNCEDDFNPLQDDLDGNGRGDACDTDIDGDEVENWSDNCPRVFNPDLADFDGDGRGDLCDGDDDGDGVPDGLDLCPRVAAPANLDLDRDGIGDACDADPDGDDLAAGRIAHPVLDRCPWAPDPFRGDADGDRLGDVCDLRPWTACRGVGCLLQSDADGDGIGDVFDTCPRTPDRAQRDRDGDGVGDACDADANGDGVLDLYQLCSLGACSPLDPTQTLPPRRL